MLLRCLNHLPAGYVFDAKLNAVVEEAEVTTSTFMKSIVSRLQVIRGEWQKLATRIVARCRDQKKAVDNCTEAVIAIHRRKLHHSSIQNEHILCVEKSVLTLKGDVNGMAAVRPLLREAVEKVIGMNKSMVVPVQKVKVEKVIEQSESEMEEEETDSTTYMSEESEEDEEEEMRKRRERKKREERRMEEKRRKKKEEERRKKRKEERKKKKEEEERKKKKEEEERKRREEEEKKRREEEERKKKEEERKKEEEEKKRREEEERKRKEEEERKRKEEEEKRKQEEEEKRKQEEKKKEEEKIRKRLERKERKEKERKKREEKNRKRNESRRRKKEEERKKQEEEEERKQNTHLTKGNLPLSTPSPKRATLSLYKNVSPSIVSFMEHRNIDKLRTSLSQNEIDAVFSTPDYMFLSSKSEWNEMIRVTHSKDPHKCVFVCIVAMV